MTTTYEATDKTCIVCNRPVEDYTGHWEASEVTACEEHHEEAREKYPTTEVVHKVPLVDESRLYEWSVYELDDDENRSFIGTVDAKNEHQAKLIALNEYGSPIEVEQ